MKKNSNKENLRSYDAEVLSAALKKYGFVFPENEYDIEQFEKTFGSTEVELPSKLSELDIVEEVFKRKEDVVSINGKHSTPKAKKTSKRNDYFKKVVLAAHIVYELHTEATFGRVKFVKLLYLCEEVCEMELSTCYGKYAAGPFDPKLLNSIQAEFKKQGWFTVKKTDYGFKYFKDQNAEDYKKYYPNYFRNSVDTINEVINLFRKFNSDFCEIVATMFFVWKENIEKNHSVTNPILIADFYSWDEKKKRFKPYQLEKAITWMEQNHIVPKH